MKSDTKKVLFVLNGTPSEKYRVINYLIYIRDTINRQVDFKIIPYPQFKNVFKKRMLEISYYLKIFFYAPYYDLLFIQKKLIPIPLLFIVSLLNPAIVFDFDDAIYAQRSWTKKVPSKKTKRFIAMIRRAQRVFAGNDYLANRVRQYFSGVPIDIFPTPVDLKKFPGNLVKQHGSPESVVIGWFGLSDNLFYFDEIVTVLETLGQKYPDKVTLMLVSDKFRSFHHIRVIEKLWKEEEEPADIACFDIGIMPLLDDEWSRGKCGWKALLYMAMGVPVVLSPVGYNINIAEEGVHGFFASSEKEWIDKLSRLIEDAALRKQMGLAGQRHVRDHFSLPIYAEKFYRALFISTINET